MPLARYSFSYVWESSEIRPPYSHCIDVVVNIPLLHQKLSQSDFLAMAMCCSPGGTVLTVILIFSVL